MVSEGTEKFRDSEKQGVKPFSEDVLGSLERSKH